MQIAFHGDKAEELSQHSVRLPKDSNVGQLLSELRHLLPPTYRSAPLRLLEIYMSKIYKVCKQFSSGVLIAVTQRHQGCLLPLSAHLA